MAKATRTAILAAFYFLIPLAICVGLLVIGTFTTGYLFTANLLISVVALCCFFVAAFLSFVRRSQVNALTLLCSFSLVIFYIWRLGEDKIRNHLYAAEVALTPDFDKKCIPAAGIRFGDGDALRLCSAHDFNLAGWIDLIVKIDGASPKEHLIDDVNSGNIDPTVRNELKALGTWTFAFTGLNSVTGRHLLSDYYLIRYHMCGNANPSC